MSEDRIARLVSRFDGLIKYAPMLQDHPDWTDEQCLAFARKFHAKAVKQRKTQSATWNHHVPYCRNIWREDLA